MKSPTQKERVSHEKKKSWGERISLMGKKKVLFQKKKSRSKRKVTRRKKKSYAQRNCLPLKDHDKTRKKLKTRTNKTIY